LATPAVVIEFEIKGKHMQKQTKEGTTTSPISIDELRDWLVSYLARQLFLAKQEIDTYEPIASFGLDSVEAANLSADLMQWLDRDLPATLVWDYPTIELLANHLSTH
jgi:acyl carrier protein